MPDFRPTKFANEAKSESDMPGEGDDEFMHDYIAGKTPCYSGEELQKGEGPEMEVTSTNPEKVK